ncbi:Pr6Pr family membrane protein [Arthrobacter sp. MMS18-M83]|uniref:Pr6Pr family membrane protein n=1 Tax=Arthrobacter sp. MMS18-M83 TaxID=2996261 RepID=UPI00227AC2EC|nr:Pr6Pr family membrane protein [Arthrobacter sp. MMS18-M83]WAH98628.1 Pr6Pr family membrane protein [Arthrobacter sp. MMS18-M83]
MTKRNVLIGGRLFFALLTLVAVGTQLTVHIGLGFDAWNFFSYFTNLSNIFASVVLLVSGYRVLVGKRPSELDDATRGTATIAMAVVGLVFGALLAGQDLGSLLPWVNFVVHYLMPVVMVADWLFQPPRSALTFKHLWYWLLYPVAYLTYSLIRGSFVNWYAYWFIDPARAGGWGGVVVFAMAIAIGFLAVSLAMMRLGNKLERQVNY